MQTEPVIRRSTHADIPGLCVLLDEQNALHVALLPSFFKPSQTIDARIHNTLEDSDAEILVVEELGQLVGLVELRITETKPLPVLVQKRYAYIQELFVAASYRGQGIGSALMAAARAWASDRGASALRTSVVPSNTQARAFYTKHGFSENMLSIEAELEEG